MGTHPLDVGVRDLIEGFRSQEVLVSPGLRIRDDGVDVGHDVLHPSVSEAAVAAFSGLFGHELGEVFERLVAVVFGHCDLEVTLGPDVGHEGANFKGLSTFEQNS